MVVMGEMRGRSGIRVLMLCALVAFGPGTCLVAWSGSALGQTSSATVDNAAEWPEADYSSLLAFVEKLQGQRYMGLVFKRISGDLAAGNVMALEPVLKRYYRGRLAHNATVPLAGGTLMQTVADEVRSALAPLRKSTDLSVPAYIEDAAVRLAQNVVSNLRDPSLVFADIFVAVERAEDAPLEKKPEPKTRAENTGLYRDVEDMIEQSHIRFLVGGDAVMSKARVLGEILRIARNDNLIVDRVSVDAFTGKLVEAGLVHADERHLFTEEALIASGLKSPPPPDLAKDQEVIPPADPPVTVVGEDEDVQPEPDAAVAADDTVKPDTIEPVPMDDADKVEQDPAVLVEAAPQTGQVLPTPREVPAHQPSPVQTKQDFLITLEVGAGVSVPTHKGDLGAINQRLDLEPGLAARFGVGGMWLNAIGGAHVSLSLVGIVGETDADVLRGFVGPGSLNVSGAHLYYGVMPFVALEWQLGETVNIRIGGGLGVAHQRLDATSAGVKVVSARGTSLLAQIGGGARFRIAECMDAGLDVFATYLDGVRGTGIGGAPVSLGGAWDVAVYGSIRVGFAPDHGGRGCGVFGP